MILKVPYYSQFKDTKRGDWKNKACGIVALKMVLDFYKKTSPSIDELYKRGLEFGGYLKNVGWYHHSLARLAQKLGYQAVTRSWNIPKQSLKHLKKRGFRTKDIKIINQQQLREGIFTLKDELDATHPVIVSLPRSFTKGGLGHLVVLIGYDKNGFYINDPDDSERAGQKVSLNYEKFKKIWKKRAIFIYPG